jgi:hypothetical protein
MRKSLLYCKDKVSGTFCNIAVNYLGLSIRFMYCFLGEKHVQPASFDIFIVNANLSLAIANGSIAITGARRMVRIINTGPFV